jgi:hypothetical protein
MFRLPPLPEFEFGVLTNVELARRVLRLPMAGMGHLPAYDATAIISGRVGRSLLWHAHIFKDHLGDCLVRRKHLRVSGDWRKWTSGLRFIFGRAIFWLVLHCEDFCALALGLLDIEIGLGLAKFFESAISSFERIVKATWQVVLVE